MIATVEDGKLVALRPDKDHPLSSGFACQKGIAFTEVHNDPDRVTTPLRRGPNGFEPVSWDDALSDIAGRLSVILRRDGSGAVGWYMGNPGGIQLRAHVRRTDVHQGTGRHSHYFTASSQDTNSRLIASQLLYGVPTSVPIPDLTRTDLLVMMGANPVVSHGSFLTAPRIKDRMHDIVKRGGRVVVVDPRRTETAAAFEWLGIVPDTDAFLLLSLLQVMFADGLVDVAAVSGQADGIDWLQALCNRSPRRRPPSRPESTRRASASLAHDLVRTPRAAVYGRLGTCVGRYGTLVAYLIDAVNLVAGNLDAPGRFGVRPDAHGGPAMAEHHHGCRPEARLSPPDAHRRHSKCHRLGAGRPDGQGNHHTGRSPDQGDVRLCGQSRPVGAQRRRARGRASSSWTCRWRSTSTSPRRPPMRLHPAGHHDVRARRLPVHVPGVSGHAVSSGHRGRRRTGR